MVADIPFAWTERDAAGVVVVCPHCECSERWEPVRLTDAKRNAWVVCSPRHPDAVFMGRCTVWHSGVRFDGPCCTYFRPTAAALKEARQWAQQKQLTLELFA